MEEKLKLIVLGVVKHSDRNNVLTAFDDTRGRMAFLIPTNTSRTARMRNSLLMPLSVVEIEANLLKGRDLHTIKSVAPITLYKSIYFNPIKSSIALFLSEFLNRLLRDAMPDQDMWLFIVHSLQQLDSMNRGVANFHIYFLFALAEYLGIAPDTTKYENHAYFDMRAGCYTYHRPTHNAYLQGQEATLPAILGRMNYRNLHLWQFTREERRSIVKHILDYYEIHMPGLSSLRSIEILRQLFD